MLEPSHEFRVVFKGNTPCDIDLKVKVKFRSGVLFSTKALSAYCTLDPKGVSSFTSRGAARQAARKTSAREGRNYSWNLANNLVIHLSR
jgi:hypothetical protein